MGPFSSNVIFVDTEFSDLDPNKGEILSIGLIKMSGASLYLELEHNESCSAWVEQHIIPMLTERKYSRLDAIHKISRFVGRGRPYMMSYVNQYDAIYLKKLFGRRRMPFNWIPIDFASLLFALSIDPNSDLDLAKKLGLDPSNYQKHHALDDARLLRDMYLRIIDKTAGKDDTLIAKQLIVHNIKHRRKNA